MYAQTRWHARRTTDVQLCDCAVGLERSRDCRHAVVPNDVDCARGVRYAPRTRAPLCATCVQDLHGIPRVTNVVFSYSAFAIPVAPIAPIAPSATRRGFTACVRSGDNPKHGVLTRRQIDPLEHRVVLHTLDRACQVSLLAHRHSAISAGRHDKHTREGGT